MAFRGRGRGRGRGYVPQAKQVPFELFPEIDDLPDLKNVAEQLVLVVWGSKLQKFWTSSPYYYEGVGQASKQRESTEIERFSDRVSQRAKRKPPLSDYIRMSEEYVPAELVEKKEKQHQKKVRWNPESDLQRLDFFEKLEQKHPGQDGKDDEKKEGEDEEEEEVNIEEEDEEYSTDGDYNQNIDFDDDEDDFNMADDNDDEGVF